MYSVPRVEDLRTVDELAADQRVRRLLPKRSALKRHLTQRDHNGLTALGIVHLSPTRRLLVDADRFVAWLYGLDSAPRTKAA
jgi:hypothetical protein